MRWNCPHCGVNLAIADEKMGNGWSFSRCYKCGGFALIRRAEVNLVKVDRAPAGEHIILPEAAEEPTAMLSAEAAQNLSRLRRENAEKSATRAATLAAAQMTAPAVAAPAEAATALSSEMTATNAQAASPLLQEPFDPNVTISGLVPPPPPQRRGLKMPNLSPRMVTTGITIAATMTVASGIYLYVQGQALWEKARTNAANGAAPSHSIRQTAAHSTAAAPAMATEIVQAPSLTDQLRHNAMAPIRANEAETSGTAHPTTATPPNSSASAANTASRGTLNIPAPPSPPAVAPAKPAVTASSGTAPAKEIATMLVVQPKSRNASLHAGPGSLYPTVGLANPGQRFVVADWNDRWFKVVLQDRSMITANAKSAWIRTDLVQVVPARENEKLPDYP